MILSLRWNWWEDKLFHVRKSTNDTKRAIAALCITASGKALTPMIVFKGKPQGRIVTRGFPEYPLGMEYACQDNVWMDETVMLQWVNKVLKPYVDDAPEGIIPILFLDSYRCHIMLLVEMQCKDWVLRSNTFLAVVLTFVNLLMLV